MLSDKFTERLKQEMKNQGLRQVDLIKKTKEVMKQYIKDYKGDGIDKTLLNKYIKGVATAKQDNIFILAKALNVSEGWLMGYDVDKDRDWLPWNDSDDIKNIKIDNARYIETTVKTVKIPILGKVPAGVPIEAIEDIIGYEEIPANMLNGGNNYFALKVDGDSMYPDYQTGDIIIIKQQPDCNSGDDCIVLVNGYDATLKRVIKDVDGIKLKPLNNDYETKKYSNEDIIKKPVIIVGVVKELRRKRK